MLFMPMDCHLFDQSPYFKVMIKHACDDFLEGTFQLRIQNTLQQAEKDKIEAALKAIKQSLSHKRVSSVGKGCMDSNNK